MLKRFPSLALMLLPGCLLLLTACDDRAVELATGPAETPVANTIPTTNTSTLEVRIESPSNGATVSGTVSISVRTKEAKVRRVRTDLFIGDVVVTSNTAERFTYSWNTAGYSGSQRITAVGWDVEGKSALAAINVTVSGGGGSEPPPPSDPAPASISLDPDTVTAGQTSTGTVVLSAAAPAGGTVVALASSKSTVATVPSSVTVAEGQTAGTFTVTSQSLTVADGAAISATSGGVTRTASLWVTPASSAEPPPAGAPTVAYISLHPDTVTAGQAATGRVALDSPAPSGGTAVSLVSNKTTVATVPSSVTVAAGDTTTTFPVSSQPVASTDWAAITATSGGSVYRTATLWVTPAGVTLDSLTLSPTIVPGGETSQGTVRLTGPAPAGGASVELLSQDTTRATVPASVTVPAGQTTATFTVTAKTGNTGGVNINAIYGGVLRFARLFVTQPAPGEGQLASLTITPDLVVGGEPAQGTVTLGAAAGSDTQVTLTSSTPSVATVPPSVTVPAGAISATFTITTLVNDTGTGQFSDISGQAGGVTRSATITTTGAPSGPAVSAVRLFPSTLGGGGRATGIITFNGPLTDGVLFDFAVSHPDIVTVLNFIGDGPATERNAQRFWSSTERAFAITTKPVASNTPVTITVTACCGGVGQGSATLNVTTDPPPPPDVVRITSARWRPGGRGGTLEVRAESSSATALLTVYMVRLPDRYLMVLNPIGGGRYEGQQSFGGGMTNPEEIEVRSNLGGSATSRVRE